MTVQKYETREAWLIAAMELIAPLFAPTSVPPARVSVGQPIGRGLRTAVAGQCWAQDATEDGISQIFVSPKLHEAIDILKVLTHEMCHLIDNCESGHRGAFVDLAKTVGLQRPWTGCNPSQGLLGALLLIEETLGEFPHSPMKVKDRETVAGTPESGTRMLKVACGSNSCETFDEKTQSGYTLRTTRKWLDLWGAPNCPACGWAMDF